MSKTVMPFRNTNVRAVCHLSIASPLRDFPDPDRRPLLANFAHHVCSPCPLQLHALLRRIWQFLPIPPRCARIELPSAMMLPPKDVVDDIWHEERDSWEVVPAAFETPISGAEDKRSLPVLR